MTFRIRVDSLDAEIAWDNNGWTADSDESLVRYVRSEPALPLPLVEPSPIIEVDWDDEVWVWLHAMDVMRRFNFSPLPVETPEFPELGDLPDGAIA